MWSIRLFWILGLASLVYSIAYTDIFWIIACFCFHYTISIFGNSICYHRYLSHRSFETGPKRKIFLLAANLLSGQGRILHAVAIHRHHHKHSDAPLDPHSSRDGYVKNFFFTLNSMEYFEKKKIGIPIDLFRDKVVMFFHRRYLHIWIAILAVTLLINLNITLFLLTSVGFTILHTNLVRTFLSHGTCSIFYRNYNTDDLSSNTKFQLLSLSESLHNNHHRYPNSYNHAVYHNEYDPAGWIVKKFFATS